MPILKSADFFIERSLNLLLSNPSETRISITYGSKSKKDSKKPTKVTKKTDTTDDANRSFVSFKVYDPKSGSLYKLNTTKSKELSKVLTALGPHGVQIAKGEENPPVSVRGFSSVLANVEVPAYDEEEKSVSVSQEQQHQQQPQQAASSNAAGVSGKKGKKKKGKK